MPAGSTAQKSKGKDAVVLRMELRRGAHLPFPGHWARRWIYTTKSVTHGQCDPETYDYLPSHRASPPFDRYQLILLGEQRHRCVNNLTRVVSWSGAAGTSNLWPIGCKSDALTNTSPRHTKAVGKMVTWSHCLLFIYAYPTYMMYV